MVSDKDRDRTIIVNQEIDQGITTESIEPILPPKRAEVHTDIKQKMRKQSEASE